MITTTDYIPYFNFFIAIVLFILFFHPQTLLHDNDNYLGEVFVTKVQTFFI